MDEGLPCLACGYDLRAAPTNPAGRLFCPECGRSWEAAALREGVTKSYVGNGHVLAWVLGMPVAYCGMGLMCCCGVLSAINNEWGLVVWAVGWVSIIGFGNRDMAGRLHSRWLRLPEKAGVRRGPVFWGALVGLTVAQLLLTVLYPVLFLLIWAGVLWLFD